MIGFYAHHHGSGHVHRCRTIMAALGDQETHLLSTDPTADVILADDAPTGSPGDALIDPTSHGTLHFAPLGWSGLTERMGQIAGWIADHRPRAFYVDVSVEVAALVRLMGVPVVTLAMPGARDDAAHQLGYRQACAIIAAWPNWVPLPVHLRPHGQRVHQVGGISRFDAAPEAADAAPAADVVVLAGKGGHDWTTQQWDAVQAACPDRTFTFLGGDTAVADPLPYLKAARVVVAAAGQNSIADIAVAGTPAVILPQDRPFGEQHASAEVLRSAGLAQVPDAFPDPGEWPQLLAAANAADSRWARWQTAGAADRAADVIQKVSVP